MRVSTLRAGPGLSRGLCAALLAMVLHGNCPAAQASRPLHVFVSIPPQAFFVERIAGAEADVEILVGPGQSPHTFEPSPRQLAALADCDVYFSIGLPFEERIIRKLSGMDSGLRIVDTSWNVPRIPMDPDEEPGGLPDPHTWLDPTLAALQAENICGALAELSPRNEPAFHDSLAALESELGELNKELSAALAPFRGEKLYVFHPAFGYFAHAYGLIQVAVESSGTEPGPRELTSLIGEVSASGAKVIFVQPQYSTKTARTLAREAGAVVVPIDPLAEDYIYNLREIADAVRASLED
ncbi:MAG: zinc ABC transporter substrate-binding protein [Candidatus Eisenbacteria bacterium]|nr:zinc ABC transporter substrate-binding protein [Candidatus Eisenbacteria bacterium]